LVYSGDPRIKRKAVVRFIGLPLKKYKEGEIAYFSKRKSMILYITSCYKGIDSVELKYFAGTRIFFHQIRCKGTTFFRYMQINSSQI